MTVSRRQRRPGRTAGLKVLPDKVIPLDVLGAEAGHDRLHDRTEGDTYCRSVPFTYLCESRWTGGIWRSRLTKPIVSGKAEAPGRQKGWAADSDQFSRGAQPLTRSESTRSPGGVAAGENAPPSSRQRPQTMPRPGKLNGVGRWLVGLRLCWPKG